MHGDIKPANLLRSGDGTIKLSDFGLASFLDAVPNSAMSGTPNNLAPEILDGTPNSIQSDMYALGVTLIELTFAQLPFQLRGKTLRERLETHRTAEIGFLKFGPRHFRFCGVICWLDCSKKIQPSAMPVMKSYATTWRD